MLHSPIENEMICKKNEYIIFYFEWLFDLYGNQPFETKLILNEETIKSSPYEYSLLTESNAKKLNFSRIKIYVDNNLINQEDFLCIDLHDKDYYSIYRVMAADCYIRYPDQQKTSYKIEFKLFDNSYKSYVTYDNKFLKNKDSWGKSTTIYYSSSLLDSDSSCSIKKDPFLERISCIDKINNCMYCENESSCQNCNYGFALFNGECLPVENLRGSLKYLIIIVVILKLAIAKNALMMIFHLINFIALNVQMEWN